MLRASVQASGEADNLNLMGVVDGSVSSGVPHGDVLVRFAEALVTRDPALAERREELRAELGEEALVNAAGTAGNFQRLVRIADSTGIPLTETMEERSVDLRAQLGLDRFRHADVPAALAREEG